MVKVGFFDSGIGGTCIWRAFRALCPAVATEYLADTAHCPYGNRPPEEILRLSEANVRELVRRGCGLIVIACNTATAAAIDTLRARHPNLPFVGLEPAVKPAALRSKAGIVGVLATAGTFNGRLYNETKARFAKNVTVIAAVADEFVKLVERAYARRADPLSDEAARAACAFLENAPQVERAVRAKIEPLLAAGCDKIVLGCTHFPHLLPVIERVVEGRAEVFDPSAAVARQIRRVLSDLEGKRI